MESKSYDQYISVTEKGTQKVLSEFNSILPPMRGKRILDVGCGTGLLLEQYAKDNEVVGIDANKKSLEIAAKKGIKTKQCDLEKKLPFKDDYFDLVVCKDVLEFVTNSDKLLGEMVRVTKRDGQLLLHVPNEFTILDLLNYAFGKGILKKRWYENSSELTNPHVRFFTKKGLVDALEKKGMLIDSDYSYMWSFTIPGLGLKPWFLSKISSRLFSPGTALLCRKK